MMPVFEISEDGVRKQIFAIEREFDTEMNRRRLQELLDQLMYLHFSKNPFGWMKHVSFNIRIMVGVKPLEADT